MRSTGRGNCGEKMETIMDFFTQFLHVLWTCHAMLWPLELLNLILFPTEILYTDSHYYAKVPFSYGLVNSL